MCDEARPHDLAGLHARDLCRPASHIVRRPRVRLVISRLQQGEARPVSCCTGGGPPAFWHQAVSKAKPATGAVHACVVEFATGEGSWQKSYLHGVLGGQLQVAAALSAQLRRDVEDVWQRLCRQPVEHLARPHILYLHTEDLRQHPVGMLTMCIH